MLTNEPRPSFSGISRVASGGDSEPLWSPVCGMRGRRRAVNHVEVTATCCHGNSKMAETLTKRPLSPSKTSAPGKRPRSDTRRRSQTSCAPSSSSSSLPASLESKGRTHWERVNYCPLDDWSAWLVITSRTFTFRFH